jgi:hypothetical protein
MKLRRLHVQQQLLPHERVVSLAVFPLMGVNGFTDPPHSPQGPVAQSLFTPDEVIFQHRRFPYVLACRCQRSLFVWEFCNSTWALSFLFLITQDVVAEHPREARQQGVHHRAHL